MEQKNSWWLTDFEIFDEHWLWDEKFWGKNVWWLILKREMFDDCFWGEKYLMIDFWGEKCLMADFEAKFFGKHWFWD